ncbi:DNA mismatch repair protein Msh6 [Pelomyxa schiedti]|nr:DNA mismatch repair protein Msh6 [Pelomyxa schiedti]
MRQGSLLKFLSPVKSTPTTPSPSSRTSQDAKSSPPAPSSTPLSTSQILASTPVPKKPLPQSSTTTTTTPNSRQTVLNQTNSKSSAPAQLPSFGSPSSSRRTSSMVTRSQATASRTESSSTGTKRGRSEVGESAYDVPEKIQNPGTSDATATATEQPDYSFLAEDIPLEALEELDRQTQQEQQAESAKKPSSNQPPRPTTTLASKSTPSSQTSSAAAAKAKAFIDGSFNLANRKQLHKEATGEQRYEFMVDLRDANMRTPDDPNYDKHTLHIPAKCLAAMTAFERQYWLIKQKHFDTIIFFRKGKFYELYENDADLGERVLGLKVTARINMRMVGVPEAHLKSWMSKLIRQGYWVGQVDEITESPTSTKKQKVGTGVSSTIMKRELTRVYSPGTLVEDELLTSADAQYLLVFAEDKDKSRYGIFLADASTGDVRIGEFSDDKQRSNFETLLSQNHPGEVLYEKSGSMSPSAESMRIVLTHARKNTVWGLVSGSEFWGKDATLMQIKSQNYFGSTDETNWPPAVRELLGSELAMSAMGAAIYHLQSMHVDQAVMNQKRIRLYSPMHTELMAIDAQTLRNLEILSNAVDGGTAGTLLKIVDHTVTPFGKRMIRQWLCNPPKSISQIEARHDSVSDLMANGLALAETLSSKLHSLPDLERMCARAHSGALPLPQFIRLLSAFDFWCDTLSAWRDQFRAVSSALLRALATFKSDGGVFPDLQAALEELHSMYEPDECAVTQKTSKKKPVVVKTQEEDEDDLPIPPPQSLGVKPKAGSNEKYDTAAELYTDAGNRMQKILQEAQALFHCDKVCFRSIRGGDVIINVPKKNASNVKLPEKWTETDSNMTAKRYTTPILAKCIAQQRDAREIMDSITRELLLEMQTVFAKNYRLWTNAVGMMAQLDCLQSLAHASTSMESPTCRPKFYSSDTHEPFLVLRQARHPCVALLLGQNFVPNDLILGHEPEESEEDVSPESSEIAERTPSTQTEKALYPSAMLITGPNMGGKTTLLRQTCICVILGQLGCRVPAEYCSLTPVDRIFTRIGASDNITRAQSTFMVELQETSSVLHNATRNSLVLLDELGRGTSTYDGYAIAYAVLCHLANTLGCRTLFSTHYTTLTDEFAMSGEAVALYHMACHAPSPDSDVVMLFSLRRGVCPKSYGMMVARCARVPEAVVQCAQQIAARFESDSVLAKKRDQAAAKNEQLLSQALQLVQSPPTSNTKSPKKNPVVTSAALAAIQHQILGSGNTH